MALVDSLSDSLKGPLTLPLRSMCSPSFPIKAQEETSFRWHRRLAATRTSNVVSLARTGVATGAPTALFVKQNVSYRAKCTFMLSRSVGGACALEKRGKAFESDIFVNSSVRNRPNDKAANSPTVLKFATRGVFLECGHICCSQIIRDDSPHRSLRSISASGSFPIDRKAHFLPDLLQHFTHLRNELIFQPSCPSKHVFL
jgi:hypothetical protein